MDVKVLLLAAALFCGCGRGAATNHPQLAEPSYVETIPALPATDPAAITVLGSDRSTWPRGISVSSDQNVELEADFPTADDPHRIIGSVHVRYAYPEGWQAPVGETGEENARRWGTLRARALRSLREKAAAVGANAIYLTQKTTSPGAGVYSAVALHVSDAKPVYPSADEVLASLDAPAGFRPTERMETTLADQARFTVKGSPQTCFTFHLALAAEATIARFPGEAPGFRIEVESEDPAFSRIDVLGRVFRDERGHVIEIDCATTDQPITVYLRPYYEQHLGKPLGEGTVVVQVYERKLTAAERAERRQRAERRRRTNCSSCAHTLGSCADPNLCKPYRTCLARHGLSPRSCASFR